MTLTTHGTEYFRDPELVRQALRGVKVNEIDGSKFDVYAAGAVLYSMVENSFPAHSGLSQITKRCPDALRWIVRRAMAEYDRRYPSATAMLADLRVVMTADDPFKVKPADLPSVKLGDAIDHAPIPEPMPIYGPAQGAVQAAGSPVPPKDQGDESSGRRVNRPQVNMVGWWSGKYAVKDASAAPKGNRNVKRKGKKGFVVAAGIDDLGAFAQVNEDGRRRQLVPSDQRKPAKDQLRDARKRANAMRNRASSRRGSMKHRKNSYKNTPGAGVVFAGLLGLAVLFVGVAAIGGLFMQGTGHTTVYSSTPHTPKSPDAPDHADHSHDDSALAHWLESEDLARVDATALLVSNLTGTLDPELDADMKLGLALLHKQGLDTVGDLGDESTDQDIAHLAEYRNTIGAIPSDSDDLIIRTRDWLSGHTDFDGVMLMTTDPETKDMELIYIAENFYSTQPIDEGTVATLLTLLHSNGYAALPD